MPRKITSKSRRSTRNPPRESASKREQREAVEQLKEWGIRRGDMIYTVIRSVAPSGMSRTIDLYKFESCDSHGEVSSFQLSRMAAKATGYKVAKGRFGNDNGVTVKGAGMDMGAHFVETLSYAMFGEERALRQRWL